MLLCRVLHQVSGLMSFSEAPHELTQEGCLGSPLLEIHKGLGFRVLGFGV